MTPPLPAELKAMRAIDRALDELDPDEVRRVVLWVTAVEFDTSQDAIADRLRPTTVPHWSLPKAVPWTGLPL